MLKNLLLTIKHKNMDIEIQRLEAVCLVLAKAIEEGRIEGIQNEVREILEGVHYGEEEDQPES